MFTTKVFEVLHTQGVDVGDVYRAEIKKQEDIQKLQDKVSSLTIKINGTVTEEGFLAGGMKQEVSYLFYLLKQMPFSNPDRETFKKSVIAEKNKLDKLYSELNSATETLNKLMEV